MKPQRLGIRLIRWLVAVWLPAWALAAGEPARPTPAIPAAITNALAREIARDYHPTGLRQVYVLAIKGMVDDRPLHVESALALCEMRRGRWELIYMSRNPKAGRHGSTWTTHSITDSTQRGWQEFEHRPTAADVDGFLKLSEWTFAATPPFRLVRGEVFKDTWKSALGFEPAYRFPKP